MVCDSISHGRRVWKLRVHVLVVLVFICLIFHCNHVIRKPGVQVHLTGPVCCWSPPDVRGSALRLRPDTCLPPSVPEKQKMLCLLDK